MGAPFQPEKERVELPQLRLPGGEAGQGPAGLLSVGFVCKTKEYFVILVDFIRPWYLLKISLYGLQPHIRKFPF